jgi:hypothetical protein
MLRDGQLPLWNPYIFGGMPLMASVVGGAFYPPNWLFAILPAGLAMNVVVITTYHLALIGTYLYARRIGIERIGALIAGVAFTFGGFMIAHLAHTHRITAAAWLPWVLLAVENIARADSLRKAWLWASLGALFIALQFFAGEGQITIFTALVAAPCAVFALARCRDRSARAQIAAAIGVMVICGVLISLVELLPARELLEQSERSDPGPLFFDVASFPPWQSPALIFPYFFGGAMLPPYRVEYWGKEMAAIMCGYVGMLTWLLAFAAIFARNRHASGNATEVATTKVESDDRARLWLWLGVAVVSMLLAFGGYLPFELNHKLYRIPGYNSFRGLYRHQFEFTFAMAMLAGLGMSRLLRLSKELARRALVHSAVAVALVVIVVAILYRFFAESLASVNPLPARANSLTNPEFLVPLACFVLSLVALWQSAIRNPQSAIRNLFLVVVLLIDVASYGHFFHWRIAEFDARARLADPPAVQLIKSREKDFNSFRVMSHMTLPGDYAPRWPEDPNYEAINQPNISILRGLQSVSGYDILRPVRVGEIAGSAGSAIRGFVQEPGSFGLDDRGLDLLNVKYLIVGNGGSTEGARWLDYDGVKFAQTNFGVEFKPGVNLTTDPGGAAATEIAIVSTMANSTHLPDGAPVLKFRLHARDGRVIERELQAGRDTSEWAYDRADVKAAIKHARARVVESAPAEGFDSHRYLGRLEFDRAEIEKIEWIYAREDASLYVIRASLRDEMTGVSTPLSTYQFPAERWRKLGRFGQVDVYENLRAMPRAWFVDRALALASGEQLKAIKTGKISDAAPFDPTREALIEAERGDGDGQLRENRNVTSRFEIPPTAVGGWLRSNLHTGRAVFSLNPPNGSWGMVKVQPIPGAKGRTLTIPQLPLGGFNKPERFCRLDFNHPPTAVGGIERLAASAGGIKEHGFLRVLSHSDDTKRAQAQITRYEPNRIELATSNPNEGFLVLSEIFYQGWEARVDGVPTRIYRTNYTLRGIRVPAGDHKVEFVYRPQSLRKGAMGAALGLILLALAYPMMRVFAGKEIKSPN